MHEFDPRQMPVADVYKLMVGAVVPRPVAWITTLSASGVVNAAPFSAYTILSQDPALILFQAGGGTRQKDTITNVRASSEFVVNVATVPLLDQMHACSADLPAEVGEPAHFGIDLAPSTRVAVPRIAASPIAMECRLHQMFDIGNEPHTVVIGEVVLFRIAPDVMRDGKIDPLLLQPVARIGGPHYAPLGSLIYSPAPQGWTGLSDVSTHGTA